MSCGLAVRKPKPRRELHVILSEVWHDLADGGFGFEQIVQPGHEGLFAQRRFALAAGQFRQLVADPLEAFFRRPEVVEHQLEL